MIGSVERYSTANRRRTGSLAGRALRIIVIAFLLYLVVAHFFVSTYRIESVSMEPGLAPGDRVIVSTLSYGSFIPFSRARLPGLARPERGDLVVVQPPFLEAPSVLLRIFEPLARFLSLQKGTLHRDLHGSRVSGYMVKRVVGIPGDTVRLKDYVLSVKARGSSNFVAEQQLASRAYTLLTTSPAKDWQPSLPLSGNGAEIALRDNEYFVLGDNRPFSSDSRSWGAVGAERIIGKVIYRYWPIRSLGTP